MNVEPVHDDNVVSEDQDHLLPSHSRPITMPSTLQLSPNHPYSILGLTLRKRQVNQHLNLLREAIANKSFQYSHIIQPAARRVVRSYAYLAVRKLNHTISFLCHAYTQCRSAMIQLGADDNVLQVFKVLSKQDVKASTTLLDPNIPGSMTIELSWIWTTDNKL